MRYLLDTHVVSQLVRVPQGEVYASIRAELESRDTLIGANDLLIAAHSILLDAILVTGKTAAFRRVPHLRIENWQRQD